MNIMKKTILLLSALALCLNIQARKKNVPARDLFPDGTEIPAWFSDTTGVELATLGRQYRITSTEVQTTTPPSEPAYAARTETHP